MSASRLRPALAWITILSVLGALATATPAVAAAAATKPATTTTTANADPKISILGDTVSYSATVSSPKSAPPIGTVSFTVQGVVLCKATLSITMNAISRAKCGATDTPAGSQKVIATYSGDPVHSASSAAIAVRIRVPTVTSAFAEQTDYRYVGGEETYYGTVYPSVSTSTYPSGTLTFKLGATRLCTAKVQYADGGASHYACQVHPPIMGFHTVHVVYSGDINFGPSSADFDVRSP